MLKTMKVKKKLRLDELIKYIFDNDIRAKSFTSHMKHEPYYEYKNKVYVHTNGTISLGHTGTNMLSREDTYTVEVEEPITEDTIFNTLVDVNNNDEVHIAWNDSISLYDKEQTKEIHALIDGKLKLIWEAESGEL